MIWRQDCYALPNEKEPFGYKDGISHPAIEGSGIPGSNPHEHLSKRESLFLAIAMRQAGFPPMPQPEVLGRNGTYAVVRKLHQRVAAFRQYLRANSSNPQEEELLAAKMMGRWRSGAPLALSPERDDLPLGADATRNNDFMYGDDPLGLKTPTGSHIRRANPRDADVAGAVRLHRMIRRGTAYGPPLPDGVLEDDGADRGIMFVFLGSHLKRQFEFVQSEWVNDSAFIGGSGEKDPVSWSQRWNRSLHPSSPSGTPSAEGAVTVRDYPWRRILLHPGAARASMAGRSRHMICASFPLRPFTKSDAVAAAIARCRLGILVVSVLLVALVQTGRAAAMSSLLKRGTNRVGGRQAVGRSQRSDRDAHADSLVRVLHA